MKNPGAGQCKWPWFERCLLIWGKIAKACGTAGGMDNGVAIDSVGGSAQEPVNLEDTEEHDAPPHFVCQRISRTRQAGRSAAGFHNHVRDPRVIRKVTGLGGENGQFQHNRASNG
jgi:hypothetical protein